MSKREIKHYSISQINCFRSCRQKWVYNYQRKLEVKAPQRPLYIGSTIHKLLEIRAQGGSWKEHLEKVVRPEFESMPQTYQMNLGEDFVECIDKIMRQYDWCWQNEQIKYLATEVKIDKKIKGNKWFTGIVDAICELDGNQYIMEHKSFKTTKMSAEQTWLNQQTCLYIKVLNEQGWNIKGVIWDMIKTSAYEPPRVLKSGQFGKQYGTQTVLSFKDAGIEEIPESVYEDIKDNHKNFLDRYITPIQSSVVESVWNDFVETVDEIYKNKGTAKNIGRDCEWCAYKDLCQTELTGGDVAYVQQLYYTTPLQREWEILTAFQKETGCCKPCEQLAQNIGQSIDFEQCVIHCPEYKKYKEAREKTNE